MVIFYVFLIIVFILLIWLMMPSVKQEVKQTVTITTQWLETYQTHLDETEINLINKRLKSLQMKEHTSTSIKENYQAFKETMTKIYLKHFKDYHQKNDLNAMLKATFTDYYKKDQAVYLPKQDVHGYIFDINRDDGMYIVCDAKDQCFRCHEIEIIAKKT